MAYHFTGPDGPINMASTNPLLDAKSVEFQKTFQGKSELCQKSDFGLNRI